MKLAMRALACMTAFMFSLEGLPVFALEDSGDGIAYVDFTEGKSIDMTVEMGSGEAVEVDRDGRKGWQISDEQNDEAAASIYIELSDSFAGDQDDGCNERFAAESERKGDSWNYYEWIGAAPVG